MRKTYLGVVFAVGLSLGAASLLAQQGQDQDQWDPGVRGREGTLSHGTHACPLGKAIVALRALDAPDTINDFLCRTVTTQPDSVKTIESHGEHQIAESHACKPGYYLRGMNIVQDRFLCSWDPGTILRKAEVVDSVTECGKNQLMVGYNDARRRVLCASIDVK